MVWYCLKCGRKNLSEAEACNKCSLSKEEACTYPVVKHLNMCEECGHKHREGVYCHVYTEAGDEDIIDDVISESEDEAGDDSDSSEDFTPLSRGRSPGGNALSKPLKPRKKAFKMRPIPTPPFVKAIRYVRCNCKEGVPADCPRYEPVPRVVMVDIIHVQTYAEIMDPSEKMRFFAALSAERTETAAIRRLRDEETKIAYSIPLIMSYLHYGQCSEVPKVCRNWNYGCSLYKEYIDIRNFVPYKVYRPHSGQVDAVMLAHNLVYSAGDHCILSSDISSGEILGTVAKDSGGFVRLFEHEELLYTLSSNGSMRTYGLTHTGRNLPMMNTMWEHSKSVNDLFFSLPSVGPCVHHGISNHVCWFFTASEDRSVKVWNLAKLQCMRSISADALRSASFTRLAMSDRHVFVGTTTASIGVFSAFAICERDDVHLCNVANHDSTYCLQITLKLPRNRMSSGQPPWITGLLCPVIGPEHPSLWASDSTGQITIWYVPRQGLEFTPAYTVKAHSMAITDMRKTWRHVISIGDDGLVILHDVIGFYKVRTVDIMHYCLYYNLLDYSTEKMSHGHSTTQIKRRIKCCYIHENYEVGGQLVLGTNYGEVVLLSLGTTV